MDALIALVTTVALLVPISVVGAVLAWADSRARHREATEVRSSSLFEALLADREDGPRAALRRRGPPRNGRSPHGGAAKPWESVCARVGAWSPTGHSSRPRSGWPVPVW